MVTPEARQAATKSAAEYVGLAAGNVKLGNFYFAGKMRDEAAGIYGKAGMAEEARYESMLAALNVHQEAGKLESNGELEQAAEIRIEAADRYVALGMPTRQDSSLMQQHWTTTGSPGG